MTHFIADDVKKRNTLISDAIVHGLLDLGMHSIVVYFAMQNPDGEPGADTIGVCKIGSLQVDKAKIMAHIYCSFDEWEKQFGTPQTPRGLDPERP